MVQITSGVILIADPFLKDPNFMRTAVFICEHEYSGSFGFVLTRKHDLMIGELITDLENCTFPVYYGGPVQTDSVYFLHHRPDLISGGVEIIDGIFWGGNFEEVITLINSRSIVEKDIRFFIGYSGWSEGQLDDEMKEKSWLITKGNKSLVFHHNEKDIWQNALKQMGGEYTQLIHYPIDPQLN